MEFGICWLPIHYIIIGEALGNHMPSQNYSRTVSVGTASQQSELCDISLNAVQLYTKKMQQKLFVASVYIPQPFSDSTQLPVSCRKQTTMALFSRVHSLSLLADPMTS